MAVITAIIKGITSVVEPSQAGLVGEALVTFNMPITGGADTCIMGGTAGGAALFGLSATASLAAIIAALRRDGKTITLVDRGGAVGEAGTAGGVKFYAMVWAISGGVNATFNLTNAAGATIAAAAGIGPTAGDIQVSARLFYTVS